MYGLIALASASVFADTVMIPMTHPFFQKLKELVNLHVNSTSEPVYAHSCVPSQVSFSRVLATVRSPLSPQTLSFKLDQPGYYVKDAYSLIEMTESGKGAIPLFLKKTESTDIKIEQMTSEGASRCPGSAAACYVPMIKTMYVDKSAEVGIMAPILFHEILHALDIDLEETLKREVVLSTEIQKQSEQALQTVADRLKVNALDLPASAFSETDMEATIKWNVMAEEALEVERFKTERMAYDNAFPVEKELVELFPQYYESAMRRFHFSMPHNFTDSDIISRYGITPPIIQRYLRGLCQTMP